MAALGTAMDNGESGMLQAAPQADPQVVKSKPGELAHITAMEDVMFLLYKDWIYLNRFTIDATMLPGHVFAIIPIHPKRSHQYVRHVADMFNGWTGTMGIRTRFMANAFNGGSFRIGWLPPNLSETQIHQMSLASLTAYPNQDLDPKNTEWTQYMGEDERNVMFHWMTDDIDSTRPETFGGYIVMYVAGSLVVGQQQAGTVSMVVESVGKFYFRQPSPLFREISPIAIGPLGPSLHDLFMQPGCDDFTSSNFQGIQILNSAVKAIPVGYTFANGVGGKPWDHSPSTLSEYHKQLLKNEPRVGTFGECTGNFKTDANEFKMIVSDESTYLMTLNSENGAYRLDDSVVTPSGRTSKEVHEIYYNKNTVGSAVFYNATFRGTAPPHPTTGELIADAHVFIVTSRQEAIPINIANVGGRGLEQKLQNMQANESIVTFVNTKNRSMNIQTREMSRALAKTSPAFGVSYLYYLRASNTPGPIRVIRLNPNGMMTTQAVAADALLMVPNVDVYMTYEGTIPVDSPLPPMPSEVRSYWREVNSINGKLNRRTPDQRMNLFACL